MTTTDSTAVTPSLGDLGWSGFFQQQLTLEELEICRPGRVFAVQRTGLTLQLEGAELAAPLGGRWFQLPVEERPTIGDWVLVDIAKQSIHRLLERKSLLKRMSVSRPGDLQLIAANVDTMFLVSSCNEEFNLSRMERYLTLALDAGVQGVVVLTKADLTDESESFVEQTRTLRSDLVIELVNALDSDSLDGLRAWCQPGHTISLLGSSGVGKSTLINSLAGDLVQLTRGIRDDDSKGRHTTTHRSLHLIPGGALLLDSPGMRELAIADAESGVLSLFDDIEALARECKFTDCAHESEPGCRIRIALEDGSLDERRLENYRKLKREEIHNTETVAQRHTRNRQFSKRVKQVIESSHKHRD